MTNDRERSAFARIRTILSEINVLREDLAELKTEYVETQADPMPPETWGDLVALARIAVMDAAARDKKATAEQRRKELASQLELFA